MDSEVINLSWNEFQNSTIRMFKNLERDVDFTDVTLACGGGKQLRAHKVILSSCSPFFKNILVQNPHQHPLLYINGIDIGDLKSLIKFIYSGEVHIQNEGLTKFLDAANILQIEGLQQKRDENPNKKQDFNDRERYNMERDISDKAISDKDIPNKDIPDEVITDEDISNKDILDAVIPDEAISDEAISDKFIPGQAILDKDIPDKDATVEDAPAPEIESNELFNVEHIESEIQLITDYSTKLPRDEWMDDFDDEMKSEDEMESEDEEDKSEDGIEIDNANAEVSPMKFGHAAQNVSIEEDYEEEDITPESNNHVMMSRDEDYEENNDKLSEEEEISEDENTEDMNEEEMSIDEIPAVANEEEIYENDIPEVMNAEDISEDEIPEVMNAEYISEDEIPEDTNDEEIKGSNEEQWKDIDTLVENAVMKLEELLGENTEHIEETNNEIKNETLEDDSDYIDEGTSHEIKRENIEYNDVFDGIPSEDFIDDFNPVTKFEEVLEMNTQSLHGYIEKEPEVLRHYCEYCPKTFDRRNYAIQHMKRFHLVEEVNGEFESST